MDNQISVPPALTGNYAFFFDLDGKFLFNVFEPFVKNHYDNMERKDMLKTPYDMDKFPDYKYDEA